MTMDSWIVLHLLCCLAAAAQFWRCNSQLFLFFGYNDWMNGMFQSFCNWQCDPEAWLLKRRIRVSVTVFSSEKLTVPHAVDNRHFICGTQTLGFLRPYFAVHNRWGRGQAKRIVILSVTGFHTVHCRKTCYLNLYYITRVLIRINDNLLMGIN